MSTPPGDRRKGPSVLLVANYESDVGYAWWLMESYWAVAAEEVSRSGGHCILAYPRITTVPETILNAPIEVVETAIRREGFGEVLRSMKYIRSRRIRAVYLTDWPYWHPVYALWRLVGVRSIVLHDHSPGSRPPARGVSGFIKSVLHALRIFSADRYVGVSQFVTDRMVESSKIPRDRCLVVTNGIRPFDCEPDARASVRAELGINPDSTLIVLASRATHYKNLDFAVRCLHRLLQIPELGGKVDVVHCGDGPQLAEFRALAQELGVADRFRFLGLRNDTKRIMCAADIGLHPSKGEVSLCLAIMEMMCAGLPVVVTDLDSVSGVLDDGTTCLKYRDGDLDDAVRKIRSLVEDASLRRQLGSEASTVCRANHSLAAANRRFAEDVTPWLIPRV